jgi:hypothetical protein
MKTNYLCLKAILRVLNNRGLIYMQQKYWITLILIMAVLGVIFTSFITFKNSETQPEIALAPYIIFEGTIVSISIDESVAYSEGSKLSHAPNDSAVVKIDRIVETGGSNFDWTSLGIENGMEVPMGFLYTARPAKIIRVVRETFHRNNTVSHTVVPTGITFEDGYFVFRVGGSSNIETTLPGLEVGSRFKAKVWNTMDVKIGEYEIIN